MNALEIDESNRIADSVLESFNTVLRMLSKPQQLCAAKRLLRSVRVLVEKLEREV